jgi:carboxypeptidase T
MYLPSLRRARPHLTSPPRAGRAGTALGILVLALGCLPLAPHTNAVAPATAIDRLTGSDRASVAISIAEELSVDYLPPVVYLVSTASSVDAVAAGSAATREGGLVLYSNPGSMSLQTEAELVRLHPGRVVAVGPTALVSTSVIRRVSDLLGPAVSVQRISGSSAPDVAAALSAATTPSGGLDTVVLASADSYFTVVAAAPAAIAAGSPLLLFSRGSLPARTIAELRRLVPKRAVIVGTTGSLTGAVVSAVKALVADVEIVQGPDQYAAAAAVADRFFPYSTSVVAMTGLADYGAIAAIPLAFSRSAPILLTASGDQLPAATRDRLASLHPGRIYVAGPMSTIISAELDGFSDGRIALPTEDVHYPAWDSAWHDPYEMYTLIKATEIAYPSLVHVFSIGKSYEGRDIWAAKVSDNVAVDEDEPEVMIDALHHAAEHLGVEQALYLLGQLTSGYATDPEIHRLVDTREIWIIFAVNPDGWVYDIADGTYHFWRKNRQPNGRYNPGTDLNRNYGYQWGCCLGSSYNPWDWNYRGTRPFSAPESDAVARFVISRFVDGRQQIRTHVSLHTHGEEILYPYSYTLQRLPPDMDPTDYAVFQAMARAMAATNGYEAKQSSQQYPTDGDEIDWLYGTYGIFSFTFELFPTEAQAGKGIVYPSGSVIARQTARNRAALLYLIDAAGCPYAAIGKAAEYCPGG